MEFEVTDNEYNEQFTRDGKPKMPFEKTEIGKGFEVPIDLYSAATVRTSCRYWSARLGRKFEAVKLPNGNIRVNCIGYCTKDASAPQKRGRKPKPPGAKATAEPDELPPLVQPCADCGQGKADHPSEACPEFQFMTREARERIAAKDQAPAAEPNPWLAPAPAAVLVGADDPETDAPDPYSVDVHGNVWAF